MLGTGGVKDSSGNSWFIGTHKEDLSRDEVKYTAQQKDQRSKAA